MGRKRFVVEPGTKVRLGKIDPAFKDRHDTTKAEIEKHVGRISSVSHRTGRDDVGSERVCDLAFSLPMRESERLAEVRFCCLELANAVGRASAAPPIAEVGGVTHTSS